MSDNKNAEHIGTTGVYGQLLAVATAAKGDEKMDKSIEPLKEDDKKWLEQALSEFALNSDPVKKLKSLIAHLMNYKHETAEDLVTLDNIVNSLVDLVCDLDMALDFCKLNGLKAIEDLLDKNDDEINQRIIGIISEISQNNIPVQKIVVPTKLLERFLTMLQDSNNSQKTRFKLVGTISSIVKNYPPAVIQFCKFNGPDIIVNTISESIKADDEKLVHRCVVVITNIGSSAAPELITALKVDVNAYIEKIKGALLLHKGKYSETLEYLES